MNTINNSLDFTRGSTVSKNKQTNKKKKGSVSFTRLHVELKKL